VEEVVDARTDPLAQFDKIYAVLKLLNPIKPRVAARDHHDKDRPSASSRNEEGKTCSTTLQHESNRALAVSFLRSAIGIATGRPITTPATLTSASHTGPHTETTKTTSFSDTGSFCSTS
jgi:hypothetical protein